MEIFKLFGSIFVDNDKANQSIDGTDKKAQGLAGTFGTMIDTATKWGAALATAAGVVVVGGFVKSIQSADEFEKALNGLQATTGATEEEMQGMEESLKRIYNNKFGESFQDIAQSMTAVKTATGLTGQELEKATQNALMLRDTFGTEVNETVRAADQLMKQFGISSDEAMTLIAQGFQNGLDKSGDFLDTINEYSVYFETLGYDAEEFFNTLAAGSEAGSFNLDKVGDAIKELGIRVKDGSKSTMDAYEAIGFNADQMSAKFAKGGEAAQEATMQIFNALGSIEDPLKRNQIGVALMGTQFEDLEAKTILAMGAYEGLFDKTENSLQKINDIKYDSFGEAMQGIGRNIETGLLIPLGEKVLPLLNEFAQWLIANMPSIQEKFETTIDVATSLFNGLAEAVDWVKRNSDILIPVVVGLTASIAAMQIIGTVNNLMALWKASTIAQTLAQGGLNAVLIANPIGLVITAIGLLVAAGVVLYRNWDTVKAKASELWSGMKSTFNGIKTSVLGVWSDMTSGVKGYVNKIIGSINGLIRGMNKIKFSVPDWVPGIGGMDWGVNISQIPYLAKGTDYFKGGMAIVGEEGPELVNLPRGSQVVPNDQTEELLKTPEYIVVEVNLDGQKMARVLAEPMSFELGQHTRGRGRGAGVIMP